MQCDTCDVNPVRGTRYKSVAHDDFDLCATCFAAGSGSQCGPFTRLDLPLPAGLPPVIHQENSERANANDRTPGEQSEAGIAALGQLRTRGERPGRGERRAAFMDISRVDEPASRQNTVETQAQGLQLAAVMHAVGSLWCELARCISVPPPPDAMTPRTATSPALPHQQHATACLTIRDPLHREQRGIPAHATTGNAPSHAGEQLCRLCSSSARRVNWA